MILIIGITYDKLESTILTLASKLEELLNEFDKLSFALELLTVILSHEY